MKSAEEVVNGIVFILRRPGENDCDVTMRDSVIEALNAFADSRLEEAEKITHEAMSVWCAMYASEECSKENVKKALELRRKHGGTLGYIADVESRIRGLKSKPSGEGVAK